MNDIAQNLQVRLITAYFTHCTPEWRELEYKPVYNKLYFICEGEGWLQIEGREFHPLPGQLCLMPAHTLQSYSAISERTYRKYWCHFTATVGELELFQLLEAPYCITVRNKERMQALFQELVTVHAQPSFTNRLREKATLLEIIALFLEESDIRFAGSRSADFERLELLQQYIEARLADPVTLEQLAAHVNLHPNYLVRYFHKYFGTSPLKYLTRKRMELAKMLLGTAACSIKEVSRQVGFPDTNHFAKVFRKETGLSPREFRMQAERVPDVTGSPSG